MVATISPAADNYEETLSTLRYADRAKRIVNHAVINEDPNARIIRELREEVDTLRKQLKEAESMKADKLKERLHESEKLMKEMTCTWEEKLAKTERIHKERTQALETMGISVQTSGIRVERNKCFLVNLNADPSLNELLVYYLKEHTLVGGKDAAKPQTIQLSGLGIMPEHCIIDVENEMDVYISPIPGAKTCVNGSLIDNRTALRHGDRILLGNYHFFRINCPRPPGAGSSEASTPEPEPQNVRYDFDYAQHEVMMKELTNDPIQAAMKLLENQHQKDKEGALKKQQEMYEKELDNLRKQLVPSSTQRGSVPDTAYFSDQSPGSEGSGESGQRWADERYFAGMFWDDLFRHSLAKLREDVVKANALVREANFLGEEMGKQTEFRVTLQIPACNLTPNRKRGSIVSEPAIQVNRKERGSQIWSVEKLENKIIDMREMYNERKEKGMPLKDSLASPVGPPPPFTIKPQDFPYPLPLPLPLPSPGTPSPKMDMFMAFANLIDNEEPVIADPFYESQENHSLIGVANIFLEVLFHDVRLDYAVPVISQQGEVAGKLHIDIQRISGTLPEGPVDDQSESSNESSSGYEGLEEPEPEGGLAVGAPLTCKVRIREATDLPPSLAHFVFCQYTFWGQDEMTVVPPYINPELDDLPGRTKEANKGSMRFNHAQEYIVNVSEEFIEHALEGSLAIEVWGHRSSGFNSSKPGWEIDNLSAKSRSLADRWSELIRKIELNAEIHELSEQGEYVPVECLPRPEVLTGGIFQLRQGHSRRILVRVKPVQNSGTLPIICEAITSISVGSICGRSKLQKGLDSYQDDDLNRLRERWSEALMRRREYLDEQIHKIIHKKGKTKKDSEREASLINQWVSLTEERNAVLVPAPGSGIPGAPANWDPPPGMETHIPVLFLDLNADDMGTSGVMEGMHAAGYHSILPKEHGTKMFSLPIVKYYEKDVCAVASWDSSIHDSQHLNRVTGPNERIYLIIKAVVQLSHPAMMELVVRKRVCVNIYKKQGFTSTFKKKIGRLDSVPACGVTYEIVSNIPKASEDPEDRESLALMAASGAEENTQAADGETYIEKYTKGVSAVESILALDRLRQEVVIKEKLAARGRPLRKTTSVPNISGAMSRSIDTSRSMDGLDEDFRLMRSESLRNLSPTHSPGQSSFVKPPRPRSLVIAELGLQSPHRPDGFTGYETFHYSLSPQYGAHSPSNLASMYLSSPVGVRPSYSKTMKPLRTVREEHQARGGSNGNRRNVHKNTKLSGAISIPPMEPTNHRGNKAPGSAADDLFDMSLEDSSIDLCPLTGKAGDASFTSQDDGDDDVVCRTSTPKKMVTSEPHTAGRGGGDGLKPNIDSNSKDLMTFEGPDGSGDNSQSTADGHDKSAEVDKSNDEKDIEKDNGLAADEMPANEQQVALSEIDKSNDDIVNFPDSNGDDLSKPSDVSDQNADKLENGTLPHDNANGDQDIRCENAVGISSAIRDENTTLAPTSATHPNGNIHNDATPEPEIIGSSDEATQMQSPTDTHNAVSKPVKIDEVNTMAPKVSDEVITDSIACVEDGEDVFLVSQPNKIDEANGIDPQFNTDTCTENGKDVSPPAEPIKLTEATKMDRQSSNSLSGDEPMCASNGQDISPPSELIRSDDDTFFTPELSNSVTSNDPTFVKNGHSVHLASDPIKIDVAITPKLANLLIAEDTTCAPNGQDNQSSSQMIISNDNGTPLESNCSPTSNNTVFQNRLGPEDRDYSVSMLSLTDSESFQMSDTEDDMSMSSCDGSRQSEKILPDWLEVGASVIVGNKRRGVVKFIGNTAFRPGVWVGVALEANVGKHNGCVQGVRYFTCRPKRGVFVRPERLAQAIRSNTSGR
ncbi:kinesin-like protein KIF13A isoform X2 [Amphiura filiformis]|uniref:kinesin-like protein KIF13A isoform X2 n=1 Tax=Amphiura filiformis TaxID=82378 RepID=UPI003B214375